jgi:hypothetical protein
MCIHIIPVLLHGNVTMTTMQATIRMKIGHTTECITQDYINSTAKSGMMEKASNPTDM